MSKFGVLMAIMAVIKRLNQMSYAEGTFLAAQYTLNYSRLNVKQSLYPFAAKSLGRNRSRMRRGRFGRSWGPSQGAGSPFNSVLCDGAFYASSCGTSCWTLPSSGPASILEPRPALFIRI